MSGIATQGQTILRDSVAHRQLDRYYHVPNISQKQYITDLAEYIPHTSNNATDVTAYHIVGNNFISNSGYFTIALGGMDAAVGQG